MQLLTNVLSWSNKARVQALRDLSQRGKESDEIKNPDGSKMMKNLDDEGQRISVPKPVHVGLYGSVASVVLMCLCLLIGVFFARRSVA